MDNKMLRFLFCTLMLFGFIMLSNPVSAEEMNNHSIAKGDYSLKLKNGLTINGVNGNHSKIEIQKDNQILYSEEVIAGEITNVYEWDHYILVETRLQGSGNIMSFDLFSYSNTSLQEIFQSNDYMKGKLSLKGNQFSVEFPIYDKDDSLALPSLIQNDTFSIEGIKVTKVSQSKEVYQYNPPKSDGFLKFAEENPSVADINRLLTEAAIANSIPPEIVKAIAFQESSWKQFNKGAPFYSYDTDSEGNPNSVGIMQVSYKEVPEEDHIRLENDIAFNIQKGIEILKQKMSWTGKLLPQINNGSHDVMEHWYFAVMAYNGMSQRNDPFFTGRPDNRPPYQDLIYGHINTKSLVSLTSFPINQFNIYYKEGSTVIQFDRKMQYDIPGPFHRSFHLYNPNKFYSTNSSVNFRTQPSTGSGSEVIKTLPKGEMIKIVSNLYYDSSILNHFPWYKIQLQNGQTGYIAASYVDKVPFAIKEVRLEGLNRIQTSTSISSYGWSTAPIVVLGRADIPIDALTGTVLAKKYNSPLLLTDSKNLLVETESEIARLGAKKIYLLGGTNAISSSVESKLKSKGLEVRRIYGLNRTATAYEVAKEVSSSSKELVIASENDKSPDSLAIGPVAGQKQWPILLTSPAKLDSNIKKYITEKGVTKVYIIGGTVAVSSTVEQQLKNLGVTVIRISGKDRVATSTEVAKYFNLSSNKIFFAREDIFVDALSGAPLAAKLGAPIILTNTLKASPAAKDYLLNDVSTLPTYYFLGSNSAISTNTRTELVNTVLNKYK